MSEAPHDEDERAPRYDHASPDSDATDLVKRLTDNQPLSDTKAKEDLGTRPARPTVDRSARGSDDEPERSEPE